MKRIYIALTVAVFAAVGATSGSGKVNKALRSGASQGKSGAALGHVKPLPPFVEKRTKERLAAADLVARGLATPDANGLVTLKNGKFVNYRLQGTEHLTAALIDFTDVRHGQIPKPDRTIDNNTYWSADVTPAHYSDMLFAAGGGSYGRPSMHDFYLQQSSGRFTWTGQVSNWVQVNAAESAFGANARKTGAGGDNANGVVYRVVQATLEGLAASGNYGGGGWGGAGLVRG